MFTSLDSAVNSLDPIIKNRLMSYLNSLGIDDISEFSNALSHLDISSRSVFLARWGLDGNVFCEGFNSLNKKLNVKNSKNIYLIAERKLADFKFTKFFNDNFDYSWMVKFGRLIDNIFGDTVNKKFLYKKIDLNFLQYLIESLSEDNRKIISMYSSNFSIKEISNTLEISTEKVNTSLEYSFRKIRRQLEKSIKKESA